jgi:hypothetical protein
MSGMYKNDMNKIEYIHEFSNNNTNINRIYSWNGKSYEVILMWKWNTVWKCLNEINQF